MANFYKIKAKYYISKSVKFVNVYIILFNARTRARAHTHTLISIRDKLVILHTKSR